jgi:ActR/RegA family two-component response regulator
VRVGLVVGPVRRAPRAWLIISPGPVRRRTHHYRGRRKHRPRLAHNGREQIAVFKITDSQEFPVTVQAQDARGNPVDLAGKLAWASSDEKVLIVTGHPDGSATVTATGKTGTAQVQVTDTETNGTQIAGVLDVTVTAGPAVSVTITPGTPSEQAS